MHSRFKILKIENGQVWLDEFGDTGSMRNPFDAGSVYPAD